MSIEMVFDWEEPEFRLYELPNEILIEIMMNFGAVDLLNMAHVCERFRGVAKYAFGKRHSKMGDCFYIGYKHINSVKEQLKYQSIFEIFGEHMIAVDVSFSKNDSTLNDWIAGAVKVHCKSLERVTLHNGRVALLDGMPKLKSVQLYEWKDEDLNDFINNHSLLESLHLNRNRFLVMDFLYSVSGKLPQLKSLHLECSGPNEDLIEEKIPIYMQHLESLELCTFTNTCLNVLKAMIMCKQLTKLTFRRRCLLTNAIAEALIEFPSLTSIEFDLPFKDLGLLIQTIGRLPNLTTVRFGKYSKFKIEDILNISMYTNLKYLSIRFESIPKTYSVIRGVAEATYNRQLKIELFYHGSTPEIIAYEGMVRRHTDILYYAGYDPIHSRTSTSLLHLDDDCFQKIMNFVRINDLGVLFNTCKRTQAAVKKYLKDTDRNWYYEYYYGLMYEGLMYDGYNGNEWIMPKYFEEGFAEYFGKHIREADFTQLMQNDDHIKARQLWKQLNRHCINLSSLTVGDFDGYRLDTFSWLWPNLTEIILPSCYDIGYENLCMFDCPKLDLLRIDNFRVNGHSGPMDHGDRFHRLTRLDVRFRTYTESVESFLMGLDDSICMQIENLYILYSGEYFRNIDVKIKEERISKLLAITKRFNGEAKKKLIELGQMASK